MQVHQVGVTYVEQVDYSARRIRRLKLPGGVHRDGKEYLYGERLSHRSYSWILHLLHIIPEHPHELWVCHRGLEPFRLLVVEASSHQRLRVQYTMKDVCEAQCIEQSIEVACQDATRIETW